jgi:hypothetical protein
LTVNFRNDSRTVIGSVAARVFVTRAGYSSTIDTIGGIATDKILQPGEAIQLCWNGDARYHYQWEEALQRYPSELRYDIEVTDAAAL